MLVGHKCSGASLRHTHGGRRCTRFVAVSHRLSGSGRAGSNTVAFDGVLDGGARLAPGTYRVSLAATAARPRGPAPRSIPTFVLLGRVSGRSPRIGDTTGASAGGLRIGFRAA